MDVWELRSRAIKEIEQSLQQESAIVEKTIALLENIAERLIVIGRENGPYTIFATICCQTIAKAYRLSLGIYSLCIDGLMVEARPLLRLLFEAWQLMVYFREEPSRTQQVIDGTLPNSAGAIAKQLTEEIHGELKGLRDYLNNNGSHISFEKDDLVSVLVPLSAKYAKNWLRTIFSVTMQIVIEGERCLEIIGRVEESFFDEMVQCRDEGLNVFAFAQEAQ